jgi:hypothetical protein
MVGEMQMCGNIAEYYWRYNLLNNLNYGDSVLFLHDLSMSHKTVYSLALKIVILFDFSYFSHVICSRTLVGTLMPH